MYGTEFVIAWWTKTIRAPLDSIGFVRASVYLGSTQWRLFRKWQEWRGCSFQEFPTTDAHISVVPHCYCGIFVSFVSFNRPSLIYAVQIKATLTEYSTGTSILVEFATKAWVNAYDAEVANWTLWSTKDNAHIQTSQNVLKELTKLAA